MKVNALLMNDADNVVTCIREIQAGEEVVYNRAGELCTLKAKEAIPYCHKIALVSLEEGQDVIKYGELIGKTSEKIEEGFWVNDRNIFSVPRNYETEYVKEEN